MRTVPSATNLPRAPSHSGAARRPATSFENNLKLYIRMVPPLKITKPFSLPMVPVQEQQRVVTTSPSVARDSSAPTSARRPEGEPKTDNLNASNAPASTSSPSPTTATTSSSISVSNSHNMSEMAASDNQPPSTSLLTQQLQAAAATPAAPPAKASTINPFLKRRPKRERVATRSKLNIDSSSFFLEPTSPPPSPSSSSAGPSKPAPKKKKKLKGEKRPLYQKAILKAFEKTSHGQEIIKHGAAKGIQMLTERDEATKRGVQRTDTRGSDSSASSSSAESKKSIFSGKLRHRVSTKNLKRFIIPWRISAVPITNELNSPTPTPPLLAAH